MAIVVILIVLAIAVAIYAISSYNGLVSLRRETENAFGQIDVQLKRRYDLIPNLVETVKGYMKHEQETLTRVIEARNRAISATGVTDKAAAEVEVARSLNGIFALSESYPELRSSDNMLSLQEELKSTENKVAFARQYYNDVVTQYNARTEMFPSSIFANMGGFKTKELFEIEAPEQREAVKISF